MVYQNAYLDHEPYKHIFKLFSWILIFQKFPNSFKDFWKFFKNPKMNKKQFLNFSKAFRKLSDISDDFHRRRHGINYQK